MIDVFIFPNHLLFWGIVITTLIALTLLVIMYLNFSVISLYIKKLIPGNATKIENYIEVFEQYKSADLMHVILLSILRYVVFTTQFILLLIAFDIRMPLSQSLIIIPVIFLVMTIIPTIALSELGIRGSISFYLIGFYLGHSAGLHELSSLRIVAASTTLWLINLAIPAIAGTFFVFNLRFIRGKNNNSVS